MVPIPAKRRKGGPASAAIVPTIIKGWPSPLTSTVENGGSLDYSLRGSNRGIWMVFRVVAVLVLVVLVILVIAAFRTGTIEILRSRSIQAPPDKVFAWIDDFHKWKQWAPQDVEDPAMKRTFSGPEHGLGAASEWSGSGNSGKGRMSIVESEPPKKS